MSKFIDLTGQKFGRLTVLEFAGYKRRSDGRNNGWWKCVCDCKKVSLATTANLTSGAVQSCGCLMRERAREVHTKHGFLTHNEPDPRIYSIWNCMKTRCYNPRRKDYEQYCKRGIIVCDEWKDNFQNFYEWAIHNGYADNLTLDRIDPNGNYCPENCRWATVDEQANNKRNTHYVEWNGEKYTISQLAKKYNIPSHILRGRIVQCGWDAQRALTAPIKKII